MTMRVYLFIFKQIFNLGGEDSGITSFILGPLNALISNQERPQQVYPDSCYG